ncbi:MAG: hypothetical protein ACXWLH_03600 [Candidatus Saccharimonadales bacterium]
MSLLERTRTVRLMPQGYTEVEAEAEASYQASLGNFDPVDIDNEIRTVEVTERTLLGKVVDIGKQALSFLERGDE